jgi:GxxExxY protein
MSIPVGEQHDPLTHAIIGAAMRVRTGVGVGLLETPYQVFLEHELRKLGLSFTSQAGFPVSYDGIRVELGFRTDLVVENAVIVELKTVAAIRPVHKAQLLTYLRLSGISVGLLMNFHAIPFRKGIHRLIIDPSRRS